MAVDAYAMTTTPTPARTSLSERVAEEIRAQMARKRITGAALAKTLKVSPAWISYRLSGKQPIDLNDLEAIAEALGVAVAELFPSDISQIRRNIHGNSPPPVRPRDTRPPGRADQRVSTPSGIRRPRRVRVLDTMPLTGSAA